MFQTAFKSSLKKLCHTRIQTCRHMSYIVLLPEDPVDTAENNALLRVQDGLLPDFNEMSGDKCYTGVGKLALDFETGVWEMEEKIRVEPKSVSFDSVLVPLDALAAHLNQAWNAAKVLYIARQDKLRKTYLSLHERARKARVHKFQSLSIYKACKTISEQQSQSLDSSQRRVVEKFLLESRLNGIELNAVKADHFVNIIRQLDEKKKDYRQKVQVSGSRFAYNISDPSLVQNFPPRLLKRMATEGSDPARGPWQVTLKPDVYEGFLEHCSKRTLRWNVWQAHNMRASKLLDRFADNSVNIEEIRKLRLDQARILGYENFGAMSMETKMAGSVENVLSMITSLMEKAVPRQAEEISSLQKFAGEFGQGSEPLLAYDVPYYSRLQRKHLFGESETLRQYFPLDQVLTVLLQLCAQLFSLQFEEVESGPEQKMWHPSVRNFNVLEEDGTPIASLYIDPYRRPGEKLEPTQGCGWFVSLRGRSSVSRHPVAALVFNFPQPGSDELYESTESLLSLNDVVTLFSKFGEALQHMLTTAPYGEVSGLTNIEWDAMPLTQHFMANWVFVPQVLSSLGRHYDTGAALPPELVSNIIGASNHMAAHKLSKHLYLANLDILLHTTKDFWLSIMKTLWPQFLPYPLEQNDQHPCSFTASLCDEWAAAYYSHTWARVMAADCTKAFTEAGEEEWRDTGKRFRSTFLSLGGGEASAEVFRLFRGRDPSPEALTDLYDISKSA